MTTATKAAYQRSITRAIELGTFKRVTPLGEGRFEVIGSEGDRYQVLMAGGSYSCTCKAAAKGLPNCHHRAAVWLKVRTEAAVAL